MRTYVVRNVQQGVVIAMVRLRTLERHGCERQRVESSVSVDRMPRRSQSVQRLPHDRKGSSNPSCEADLATEHPKNQGRLFAVVGKNLENTGAPSPCPGPMHVNDYPARPEFPKRIWQPNETRWRLPSTPSSSQPSAQARTTADAQGSVGSCWGPCVSRFVRLRWGGRDLGVLTFDRARPCAPPNLGSVCP